MTVHSRFDEAERAYLDGNYVGALTILSNMLDSGADARTMMLLGETMAKMGLSSDAAAMFERAATLDETLALPCLRRAAALHFEAGEDEEAQLAGLKVFSVAPDDPENTFTLVRVFMKTGETQYVDALKNRLVASNDLRHLQLAVELISDDPFNENNLTLFSKLRALSPADPYTRATLLSFAREFCDFAIQAAEEDELHTQALAGNFDPLRAEAPHQNIMWCDDEALNRRALNIHHVQPISPAIQAQRRTQPHRWAERIRIGYLSNDFWDDHATMRLLQSVLTAHDTSRFEVTLLCYTPERFIGFDGGNRAIWGKIVSIRDMTDAEAQNEIRVHGIDILVDLKGHTGGSRSAIVNGTAAPVQVAWLGFPGSVVNVDCDYVIGDPVVLPDSSKPHYHEKFCRLPETYQPNDPIHRALPPPIGRAELGLPQDAFIFAAFNATRKINRRTMELWARILQGAKASILWIMCDSMRARANIHSYFQERGIAAERILFAQKTRYDLHLARLQAADLGLDTFPCNGHTTTSDQLWAGLPVATAKGHNFSSRVSESLLNAIGLRELIAESEDDFVDLAVALAGDRKRLAALRSHLVEQRFRASLFDAERFCRHLESAYEMMVARARNGEAPDHFDVPALPPRDGSFKV